MAYMNKVMRICSQYIQYNLHNYYIFIKFVFLINCMLMCISDFLLYLGAENYLSMFLCGLFVIDNDQSKMENKVIKNL